MSAKTSRPNRIDLRALALTSVSLAAFAGAAEAQTASRPLVARYGNIAPFYGNIAPFYGNISPFYGNIAPFYGNISPFYGNISAFWGDISPFYGNIAPFWGDIKPFDGPIGAASGDKAPEFSSTVEFWVEMKPVWDDTTKYWRELPASPTSSKLNKLVEKLEDVIERSEEQFGKAVKAKTGKSFSTAFAEPLLKKYGIKLSDPASLTKLSEADRAMFFLDWYDNLMTYSGVDHVDHWMKTVNWTPAITQQQGYGGSTTIGLLDFTVVGDKDILNNIVKYDGISTFSNGHGAAVASLIVDEVDGSGVMGIAPRAKVIAYNPFDKTGTAGWADVTTGVRMLAENKSSIINMSLGVPGFTLHPDWNTVFTNAGVAKVAKNTVFVMAAGNEGVTQKQNVAWDANNPYLILVGSVGLDQTISNFSNRPGDSCLTINGACNPGAKLQDRFIVAPGELILVSDDKGGVVRQSGTSLAAPFVSGAVALLHDRWPWLANFPKETTDIILQSAKDLGAAGVDPVYGRGLLDVTASQSPLNFNNLTWSQSTSGGELKPVDAQTILSGFKKALKKFDEKGELYYYAFEKIGATQRDFAIPLSESLIGQSVTTLNGGKEKFQEYLLQRMTVWADASKKFSFAASGQMFSPKSFSQSGQPIANGWGADMTLAIAPRVQNYGFVQDGLDYRSMVKVNGERSSFSFGFGAGAEALDGKTGFVANDYDSDRGGANPLLGLATGGGFANWNVRLSERMSLAIGATQRDEARDPSLLIGVDRPGSGAKRYQAAAQHLAATFVVADGFTLTSSYTLLHEKNALLGTQALNPGFLAEGSTTAGYNVGVDLQLSETLNLSGSATRGVTRESSDQDQNLTVGKGGVTTSSYQVSLTKSGLFRSGDQVRISLSQPMHLERGKLDFTTLQIIDRQTGELGYGTQSVKLGGTARPYAAEILYGVPVLKGEGQVVLFGRAESADATEPTNRLMLGSQFKIRF
jgi:hypothetical protein